MQITAELISSFRYPATVSRRLFHRWLLWLLPVLAARALLPMGVMPSMHAGELQLAFCPAQAPALAAAFSDNSLRNADHVAHAHQHHQGATEQPAQSSAPPTADAPCPYAIAVVWITNPALQSKAIPIVARTQQAATTAAFVAYGPGRAEHIRGPPTYS